MKKIKYINKQNVLASKLLAESIDKQERLWMGTY
jgi:hypothetical protein